MHSIIYINLSPLSISTKITNQKHFGNSGIVAKFRLRGLEAKVTTFLKIFLFYHETK